jgi:hypothetical protein
VTHEDHEAAAPQLGPEIGRGEGFRRERKRREREEKISPVYIFTAGFRA